MATLHRFDSDQKVTTPRKAYESAVPAVFRDKATLEAAGVKVNKTQIVAPVPLARSSLVELELDAPVLSGDAERRPGPRSWRSTPPRPHAEAEHLLFQEGVVARAEPHREQVVA